jgi:predicted kinase
MSKLIILRGNSGSGKSTVAKSIAQSADHKIAIIDADAYRVDMLFPKPIHKDDFAELMQHNVLYCLNKGYDVIWDSIFHANDRNREYLGNVLKNLHPADNFIFNFKTSFEETALRHATRHKSNDFDIDAMKEWYQPNEELGYDFEYTIPESSSLNETVSFIKETVWSALS